MAVKLCLLAVFVLQLAAAAHVAGRSAIDQSNNVSKECIMQYYQLERSLFKEPLNVDSLIRTLFPPNDPPVSVAEMFYYTTDNFSVHPSQLELTGEVDAETLDECANYKFRWTRSPIFLFMNPYLMDTLSLFTVRVIVHKARLLIDPICTQYSNYTVRGTQVPLPEYYLDYMTSKMKVYALRRGIALQEGFDTAQSFQGYSSFYNSSIRDFNVLVYATTYQENLYILILALVFLILFIAIAFPAFIILKYKPIRQYAMDSQSSFNDLLWACVIVSFVAVCLILTVDVYYVLITRLSNDPPEIWAYYLGMISLLTILFGNFTIAISTGCRFFKSSFPLPYILKVFFHRYKYGGILAQILALWNFTNVLQLLAFHATFIFFGFVAIPIQAASNILLYSATIFFGISTLALFFSTFKETNEKIFFKFLLQRTVMIFVFVSFFTFSVLLAFCFLRLTIYVGDAESGGIPGLFSSLAPSLLLAGLGFVAKRMLERNSLMKSDVEVDSNKVELEIDFNKGEIYKENVAVDGLELENTSTPLERYKTTHTQTHE